MNRLGVWLKNIWRAWTDIQQREDARWEESVEGKTSAKTVEPSACATEPATPSLDDLIRQRQEEREGAEGN